MKTVFAACVAICFAVPLHAADETQNTNRIYRLETQVKTLQETVSSLQEENEILKDQVARLSGNANLPAANCADRTAALEAKLEHLQKIGFRETHPDTINAQAQLAKAKSECATEAEAATAAAAPKGAGCTATIAALQDQKDKLIVLGFKENHPDIHALSAKIKAATAECNKAG
ncbi:hypothetical protein [Kordiimonas pumila]|uniref:Uncharacterized protein n=1 Tax=Kordiimonas pumila TaxID=2161677 RepID=A0ABV7D3N8_9PROT|nr:hypothetical protein [Kordiimonas pumila]